MSPTGHLAGPGRPWVLMGLVFYRCAATILVATVATLRRKWRSFHKVRVNHHLNDLNCNTSRVNQEVIFPLCCWRGVIPLLDDLLIPLTLLTDSFLFCVLSFSGTGNRGTGEPGNRGTGEPVIPLLDDFLIPLPLLTDSFLFSLFLIA